LKAARCPAEARYAESCLASVGIGTNLRKGSTTCSEIAELVDASAGSSVTPVAFRRTTMNHCRVTQQLH
jgi:hypothetical protein